MAQSYDTCYHFLCQLDLWQSQISNPKLLGHHIYVVGLGEIVRILHSLVLSLVSCQSKAHYTNHKCSGCPLCLVQTIWL